MAYPKWHICRVEYLIDSIHGHEDVHVDVDGGARLGVVGERDCAAERVGNALEGPVDSQDLVWQ